MLYIPYCNPCSIGISFGHLKLSLATVSLLWMSQDAAYDGNYYQIPSVDDLSNPPLAV